MPSIKSRLATGLRRGGLVVTRTRSQDPWHAISRLVTTQTPVVLDIGANVGQTARRAARVFPRGRVFSFEPSPVTYRELLSATAGLPPVEAINAGVGDQSGRLDLLENVNSDMSSFLLPGDDAWGHVAHTTEVGVVTVDGFCYERGIDRIDVLKTDTQGYDLAVLRGATGMLGEGRVAAILTEITFGEMYVGAPRFDEVIGHVLDNGFHLVGIYVAHQDGFAAWADTLFVHEAVDWNPRARRPFR